MFYLLVFDEKAIRHVETQAACAGVQGERPLEALKGEETASELASRFGVHSSGAFERSERHKPEFDQDQVKEPHARIGELAIVNAFCHECSGLGA